MSTVAEVVIAELQTAGIDRVFGLPGGENVHVMEALRRSSLPFHLTSREAAAAFMASAYARLTGRPGAALSTLGPGAVHAAAGLAHAYLDREPVVLLTAQGPGGVRTAHTHQSLDLETMFGPIVKGSFTLSQQEPELAVREALATALSGRPGPVHLALSNEQAGARAKAGQDKNQPGSGGEPASNTPLTTQMQRAVEALRGCHRPLLLVGLGVEPEAPYREIQTLAEALSAPVLVTPKAKGALAEDHPLAGGTLGLTRTDPAYQLLEEADCLLAVGFDVVELVRPWEHTGQLIWIAPWVNRDPALPAAASFVGPMAPTLRQLSETRVPADPSWGADRVAQHLARHAPDLTPEPAPGRLHPRQVLRALREALPPEAPITTDVGSHKILFSLEWPAYHPNRFLVSNGLSSMGYALPAAIAARLALPGLPVACTVGDAGLAMSLGDLGLLRELGGRLVILVFRDGALDLIRSHQQRAGHPAFGTEFEPPDFVRIARAYGLQAGRADSPTSLHNLLDQALMAESPTLIETVIDPAGYLTALGSG